MPSVKSAYLVHRLCSQSWPGWEWGSGQRCLWCHSLAASCAAGNTAQTSHVKSPKTVLEWGNNCCTSKNTNRLSRPSKSVNLPTNPPPPPQTHSTHRVIIIIQVRIVGVELQQLNLDDPVLLLLGHEPGILVLHLLSLARMLVLPPLGLVLPGWRPLVVGAVCPVFVVCVPANSATRLTKSELGL